MPLDTLFIDVLTDPFYDATHLSEQAAYKVATEIKENLIRDSTNRILVIQFRQ